LRKEHSEATQALVIFLRHGTLKNDSKIVRRYTEILKMTGVRPCSQIKILRRWKARGFLVINMKRDGKKDLLTREQVRWVTDFATLQEMSHLCLERRARIIKDKFQLPSFHCRTLSDYYHRYGIKYKRPDYTYWKSRAENDNLKMSQMNYVRALTDDMEKGTFEEIIYIDETTFNLWQRASKCWLRPGMRLSMLKFRGHSITIIGAISL
jgi:transposase